MEGAETQTSPPVNNLLQPDVYNRLDAQVRERTRVANSQLDQRLLVQQNILSKYRVASERQYRRQKRLVSQELARISNRLPAVSRIPDFRNKFLYGEGIHKSLNTSLPDVRPRKIRGIPEEKPEQPFCQRYFIHHLPSKRKYYNPTPSPLFPTRGAGEGEGGEEGGGEGGEGGGELGGEGGGELGGGEGGGGEGPNSGRVTLPPLTGNEFLTSPKQDSPQVRLDPIENNAKDASVPHGSKSTLKTINPLSEKSNKVFSGKDVRDGDQGAHFSDEGRQSDRKSPREENRRTLTLPPLARQNVRLAHSSPQLYQG